MFEIEDVHKMNDDQKEYCDPQEINGNNSLQQENGTAAGDGGRAPSAAPSDDRPLGYTVMTKFVNAIEIETSEEGFNAGRSYYVKVCALALPSLVCLHVQNKVLLKFCRSHASENDEPVACAAYSLKMLNAETESVSAVAQEGSRGCEGRRRARRQTPNPAECRRMVLELSALAR